MRPVERNGRCLEILVGENDRYRGSSLHEAIVQAAREMGLDGATVLRGVDGYGATRVTHKVRLLGHSEGEPIVIWIVDASERLVDFKMHLTAMMEEADCGGAVVERDLQLFRYRQERGGQGPGRIRS